MKMQVPRERSRGMVGAPYKVSYPSPFYFFIRSIGSF